MSEENTLPAGDAQDTRTRKTVKLRAAAAPISQDIPVSDPLTSRDTDTGNLEILDDTQTRKTLKLKPMSPGNTGAPRLNLSGDGDTQTRKTVLLRPSASAASAPVVSAAAPGKAASPIPATVRLDASEVAAALEETTVGDDQTRAVPKPAAAPSGVKLPGAPQLAPKPAAPANVENDDQTRSVPKPAAAPSGVTLPAEESEDQTVKMKRPPRLTPPPAPGAPALRPPVAGGNVRATVKLASPPASAGTAAVPAAAPAPKPPTAAPAPKPPTAAPAPKPPTAAPAPKPPTAAPAPTAVLEAVPAEPAPAAKAAETPEPPKGGGEEISLAPSKREQKAAENSEENAAGSSAAKAAVKSKVETDSSNAPSLFYLILAVATLLFVACAAVITSVHYLYFEQQMDYREVISVLPNAK